MNKLNKAALFVVMATAASPGMAQSLTGGEISLGYSALTDEDLETSGTQLGISAEIALSREFALQGDVSYLDGEVIGFDGDETSLGLHAIYHANEQASFGYFFGQDRSEGEKSDFYGAKAGTKVTTSISKAISACHRSKSGQLKVWTLENWTSIASGSWPPMI